MVRTAGLEPATSKRDRFSSQLQFSLPPFGVCGLDFLFNIVSLSNLSCCPSSLYTFLQKIEGLARDCHFKGFPVFEQFYSRIFMRGTQILILSLLCIPIPPRPLFPIFKAYFSRFCNLSVTYFVKNKDYQKISLCFLIKFINI